MKLTINHRFPGLNDYTKANRTHRQVGAKMKKAETELVAWAAKAARLPAVTVPVRIRFTWHDDCRRDLDNIAFAKKFILDGLVSAGVLKGDTLRYVRGFSDDFVKCKKAAAKVVVEIEEVAK